MVTPPHFQKEGGKLAITSHPTSRKLYFLVGVQGHYDPHYPNNYCPNCMDTVFLPSFLLSLLPSRRRMGMTMTTAICFPSRERE